MIHILWVPILRKGIYFIHVHTDTHSMSSDSLEGYIFYTCTHWYTFYEFRFSGRVYILYMYTLMHILWVPILRKGIYFIHVHTHTHSMSSDSPEWYIFYTCTHWCTFYEFRFSGRVYIFYTCTHSYTFYEFQFSGRVYILYMYTLIHILWVPILRKCIYFIHVHTDTHYPSGELELIECASVVHV
jgi:ABC-type maltose transport system permease subunit